MNKPKKNHYKILWQTNKKSNTTLEVEIFVFKKYSSVFKSFHLWLPKIYLQILLLQQKHNTDIHTHTHNILVYLITKLIIYQRIQKWFYHYWDKLCNLKKTNYKLIKHIQINTKKKTLPKLTLIAFYLRILYFIQVLPYLVAGKGYFMQCKQCKKCF